MAYGIFRKVATLEFLQHHFAKSGHGDGLLMTRQLISTFRQPPLHYLTRSVRRTSGFVLADQPEVIDAEKGGDPGDFIAIDPSDPTKTIVVKALTNSDRRGPPLKYFWRVPL